MKIAIFGGAFNPVHNEHINLVKAAINSLNLDKVIVVPTRVSPHKTGKLSASEQHRLTACKLAFENVEKVIVSDYEIKSQGVSYSYKTCEHFKKLYPNDELIFIVGADMLEYFPKWKHPERILKSVTLAACAREDSLQFKTVKENFKKLFNAPLYDFNYVGKKVSSTEVRTLAALGEDISKFLPKEVENYLTENAVYLQPNLVKVKNFLSKKRWQHTVRVALLAVKNASRINLSELTVLTAAALHDCAKYVDLDSEILQGFTLPNGVPEPVIHQFSGAYMAANYFKVDDENVIAAIKYHTSARPDMSDLEKLIFLADMLEEDRNFNGVQQLRNTFSTDLTKCLKEALYHQIEYLRSTGKPIYELTQLAYNFLIGE